MKKYKVLKDFPLNQMQPNKPFTTLPKNSIITYYKNSSGEFWYVDEKIQSFVGTEFVENNPEWFEEIVEEEKPLFEIDLNIGPIILKKINPDNLNEADSLLFCLKYKNIDARILDLTKQEAYDLGNLLIQASGIQNESAAIKETDYKKIAEVLKKFGNKVRFFESSIHFDLNGDNKYIVRFHFTSKDEINFAAIDCKSISGYASSFIKSDNNIVIEEISRSLLSEDDLTG